MRLASQTPIDSVFATQVLNESRGLECPIFPLGGKVRLIYQPFAWCNIQRSRVTNGEQAPDF